MPQLQACDLCFSGGPLDGGTLAAQCESDPPRLWSYRMFTDPGQVALYVRQKRSGADGGTWRWTYSFAGTARSDVRFS